MNDTKITLLFIGHTLHHNVYYLWCISVILMK